MIRSPKPDKVELSLMKKTTRSETSAQSTRVIRSRIADLWRLFTAKQHRAHNALMASRYSVVEADGSTRNRKPTAREISLVTITKYKLTRLKVSILGSGTALATYIAEVDASKGGPMVHIKMAVSEVWVRERGEWKSRHWHGTLKP
jgi:hypothetical protein